MISVSSGTFLSCRRSLDRGADRGSRSLCSKERNYPTGKPWAFAVRGGRSLCGKERKNPTDEPGAFVQC